MTKYTAADFENARFAEHPDGRTAMKSSGYARWDVKFLDGHISTRDNYHLASFGWVPVPTKPTLSDSEVGDVAKDQSDDWLLGFIAGFEKAGGTVLEETTRERVARLVNEIISERGPAFIGEKVADRLINLGLVKDN